MSTPAPSTLHSLTRDISLRVAKDLAEHLQKLIEHGSRIHHDMYLDCFLREPGSGTEESSLKIASVDIGTELRATAGPRPPVLASSDIQAWGGPGSVQGRRSTLPSNPSRRQLEHSDDTEDHRSSKRRATGGLTVSASTHQHDKGELVTRRLGADARVFPQRKKRPPENPSLQPSTLDKFVGGVWDSISSVQMDPAEIIEQWQAIDSSAGQQPKLLTDTDSEIASRDDSAFGRMNVLTRKISQTSRTCRSLEVIVQAYWIEAFDARVAELGSDMTKERAKKSAMSQACLDFGWSEKELRNKMSIWRGYHDIKTHGGWACLVFAGYGLYRFCKYRVSFNDETYSILRALRHRFEVAADTAHPRWRSLLAIVGIPTQRRYTGHPHDWVVYGPGNEAIPLPVTYQQWDKDFTYTHLDESVIDEDAWGLFDPRTVVPATSPDFRTCQECGKKQSDDPRQNQCVCLPGLYGSAASRSIPVQVFRTPCGKNNGLIACCAFERGTAVGEFVGNVTSGLANKDVMYGQTERATYQIWQGREGNFTRFINHSCQPNSQYERFVWLGIQRIVLISKGIEAGEEITVDYGDTYWRHLDKECLCGHPKCRYRNRSGRLLTPPESS